MGLIDKFLGRKKPDRGLDKGFRLPDNVSEPVDALMVAALLLVVIPDSPVEEIRLRQRIAACAFGATDWLCQARQVSMDEMQWMQASAAVVFRYLTDGGVHRLGAETIGIAAGEVCAGTPELKSCIQIGGQAMKQWLVDSDANAPLEITQCVMQWDWDKE